MSQLGELRCKPRGSCAAAASACAAAGLWACTVRHGGAASCRACAADGCAWVVLGLTSCGTEWRRSGCSACAGDTARDTLNPVLPFPVHAGHSPYRSLYRCQQVELRYHSNGHYSHRFTARCYPTRWADAYLVDSLSTIAEAGLLLRGGGLYTKSTPSTTCSRSTVRPARQSRRRGKVNAGSHVYSVFEDLAHFSLTVRVSYGAMGHIGA